MTTSTVRLVEIGPDDAAFAQWYDVWAAAEVLDRPDDAPRPMQEHVVLGRELVRPGGSRDGSHRAALQGEDVVGALRLILPMHDNTTVAFLDVAVHPTTGAGGSAARCSPRVDGSPRTPAAPS
jgi:hypothetical protein